MLTPLLLLAVPCQPPVLSGVASQAAGKSRLCITLSPGLHQVTDFSPKRLKWTRPDGSALENLRVSED